LKRRAIATLYFTTQKDRDAAATELEDDFSKKSIAEKQILTSDSDMVDMGKPAWILHADVQFETKEHGDDTHSKLKVKLKKAEVIRGEVSIHDCTHEDSVVRPCTETNYERDTK
jgi:hypothetical protein